MSQVTVWQSLLWPTNQSIIRISFNISNCWRRINHSWSSFYANLVWSYLFGMNWLPLPQEWGLYAVAMSFCLSVHLSVAGNAYLSGTGLLGSAVLAIVVRSDAGPHRPRVSQMFTPSWITLPREIYYSNGSLLVPQLCIMLTNLQLSVCHLSNYSIGVLHLTLHIGSWHVKVSAQSDELPCW